MKRFMATVSTAILAVTLAACGSDNTVTSTDGAGTGSGVTTPVTTPTPEAPAPNTDTTVDIDGRLYACGQVLGTESGTCNESFQEAFNLWGDYVDGYVDSGKLGGLRTDMVYGDVATVGLKACIYAATGGTQSDFVRYMRGFYPDEDSVAFLPLWNKAGQLICPDAFANLGHKSHDLRVE